MCPRVALCHFCEIHGPSMVFCTSIYGKDQSINPNPELSRDLCDGCSFQSNGDEELVFVDDFHGYRYVSRSTVPESDRINVQQVVVRSLSCEVCPDGREGIIYFGDDDRGHVLSYCFVLKDSQARGFQRTYSLIVISDTKNVLIENWTQIVSKLESIIDQLKSESNSVYDSEVTISDPKERRSIRLESAIQVAVGRGRSSLNTQRSASKARSLLDLTGSDSIFVSLHLEFVSLLKEFQAKISDSKKVVEKISNFDPMYQESSEESKSGTSLRNVYTTLGKDTFRTAAYHTIQGHQVIVQATPMANPVSDQIVITLSELLPADRVKVALNCPKYFEGCNLLGLTPDAVIPKEILASENVCIIKIKTLATKIESSPDNFSSNCIQSINCTKSCPPIVPTFICNLEKVISDATFSDESISIFLDTLKEEKL